MLYSLNWRVVDPTSAQYKAGYERGKSVAEARPEGESEKLWFALTHNMPLPSDHDDFRAGYHRYVNEVLPRWYIYSPTHRAFWRRSETGTEWAGYTVNLLDAGTWDRLECDDLDKVYDIGNNLIRTTSEWMPELADCLPSGSTRPSLLETVMDDMKHLLRIAQLHEPGSYRASVTIAVVREILQHGGHHLSLSKIMAMRDSVADEAK